MDIDPERLRELARPMVNALLELDVQMARMDERGKVSIDDATALYRAVSRTGVALLWIIQAELGDDGGELGPLGGDLGPES